METPDVKELVRSGKFAEFDFFRAGIFYYKVYYQQGVWYNFCVPMNDIGTATLNAREKAIMMMRWIRKSKEEGTLTIKQ